MILCHRILFCGIFFIPLHCDKRQDMKNKKIYKLFNNERDCYDCDYTGNAEDLISPLNKLFTKTFLTEELLSRINIELGGKPYQKFHLVLEFDTMLKDKPINDVSVSIEFNSNLTATTAKDYGEKTYTIIRLVNEYLSDLGYHLDSFNNANDFLDKLLEEHPDFEEFFNIETIK